MSLLPLDTYVDFPAAVMAVVPGDKVGTPPVWQEYKKTIKEAEGKEIQFEEVERFAFYERAKKAFAVVATGEEALYGNLILKKGVLPPEK